MKTLVLLFFFVLSFTALHAQENDFGRVDKYAASVGYYPTDTLARILTKPFHTDLEKVRSIFYWLTHNISYDLEKARGDRMVHFSYFSRTDSARKRKEMLNKIIADKKGICQDYSDLFTAMCNVAGIKSVVIDGYVRNFSDEIGKERPADHAWNAVMIDNKWYLLDATWAAGFIRDNMFISKYNNYYFLPDPEVMKFNHYPAEPRWLLTKKNMTIDEFFRLPLVFFDQGGVPMKQFLPATGIIEAKMGSVIEFSFEVEDTMQKIELITFPLEVTHPNYVASYTDYSHPTSSAYTDAIAPPGQRHHIQVTNNMDEVYPPRKKAATTSAGGFVPNKNTVVRRYVVNNYQLESIMVFYNEEPMLKYTVNIIK